MFKFFSKDQLKSNFWALLVISLLFLFMKLNSDGSITVSVKPNTLNTDYSSPVAIFGSNKIYAGRLTIEHPTLIQKLFLPDELSLSDSFTLLGIIICSGLMIVLIPKIKEPNIFRKDLTRILYILAIGIILYSFLSVVKDDVYVDKEIKFLTNNQFTNQAASPFLYMLFAYIGFIIIRSIKIYKRGLQLQQEQDLTV